MRWLIILLFSFQVLAEDIVVHVNTSAKLAPLAIRLNNSLQSGYSRSYLEQLQNILSFDLQHNGYCELQTSCPTTSLLEVNTWKQSPIYYVVEMQCSEKQLAIKTLNTKTGQMKLLDGIGLTGDLAIDRRAIHRASDAMTLALFNAHGIASNRILYTLRVRKSASSAQWISEVWQSDYDGSNAQQITNDGHLCVTPTYVNRPRTGQCRDFLFVSYKIGQPKIYACNTAQGTLKRLSYLKGNQLMPCISAQQDHIAFISDVAGNPDLFIQRFSPEQGLVDKPRQLYSAPMAAQGSPTFSPDGKTIAFVSNKDGTARIYTISISGQLEPTLLTKKNRDNTCPSWSPDGKKLAYCAQTQGVRQIWIYDFETREEKQLTDGSVHKENPSWAPDSLHLIFNSASSSIAELYLINLNQQQAIKISNGPGEKRFPAWEPSLL